MAYYLKLSSMALSGCKPKLFCNTARIASALCSVKSTKYIRSNAASLNAADKKRRKCTLIPEDGVGPELVHSVLEVYKGVIDSFETVTAKKSFAFDYAIKNNRKKVTAVHKAFIMSHRFYSNSANEPDESSEPKIQVDGVITPKIRSKVNCNLYCYLNVRLLHMRSTLQAFNGQMTVDFEEKLKLNELPCSVKEKLESARKLYVNDMSYQAGFAQAEAVLLPELEARNNKLSNVKDDAAVMEFLLTSRRSLEIIFKMYGKKCPNNPEDFVKTIKTYPIFQNVSDDTLKGGRYFRTILYMLATVPDITSEFTKNLRELLDHDVNRYIWFANQCQNLFGIFSDDVHDEKNIINVKYISLEKLPEYVKFFPLDLKNAMYIYWSANNKIMKYPIEK